MNETLQPHSEANGYFQRIRMLSHNAKFYLISTSLQGLSSGIWGVLFNLYLKGVGFQPNFISNIFTASAIATGLIALPAGLFCERVGCKKAILIGFAVNAANLVQILALQPSLLLVASLSSGLIGTLGAVASAPFMMANSRDEQRTLLFSVNWASMIIMSVVGSFVGGFMPDMFNAVLKLPTGLNGSSAGYRISLAISIALTLAAAVPILLTSEKETSQKQRVADLLSLRNIKSAGVIVRFMIPTAMIGFGAGFIVPLFNIFFSLKFSATAEQIGLMSAISNITLGVGTLAAPRLSKRRGKVRSVVLCQFFSMPFIMLMTLSPNLTFAASSFIMRTALMNMAGPINSTLQMELVTGTERATTNGLMIMSDNIPRALTASVSGGMMTENEFVAPFIFTTLTYFVASSLYFTFFRKAERLSQVNQRA